jgi:hypothetical protein
MVERNVSRPDSRLTSKTYSDGTPEATFSYDQASVTIGSWSSGTLSYPLGRMTGATTTASGSVKTALVYSYDPVGRISDFWQCNPANCGTSSIYNTTYSYDKAGDVTGWTHPGLISLTNTVNSAQQVTQVQTSSQYTNLPQTLAQNVTYEPWGAVSTFGDGCSGSGCTNAQETYQYTKRLQPWVISLAAASGPGVVWCTIIIRAGRRARLLRLILAECAVTGEKSGCSSPITRPSSRPVSGKGV